MRWLLVPAGYCLGSISFSLLLVRRLQDLDLRDTGSGNLGATNVLRAAGGLPALLVLILDVAKGAVPILVGQRIGASGAVLGATALATVLGHMYPVFHDFRGGKGVATAAGAFAAIEPPLMLICTLIFLVVLALTRYVSLASILSVTMFAILAALRSGQSWIAVTSALIAALIVWRHKANLQRLLHHRETRLGISKGGD